MRIQQGCLVVHQVPDTGRGHHSHRTGMATSRSFKVVTASSGSNAKPSVLAITSSGQDSSELSCLPLPGKAAAYTVKGHLFMTSNLATRAEIKKIEIKAFGESQFGMSKLTNLQ